MIPTLGSGLLFAAFAVSLMLSCLPLAASFGVFPQWLDRARALAWWLFALLGAAFVCLLQIFLTDDFSVAYAANNSNTRLPLIYKISGVWGGHEGSMLLWVLILSLWACGVALFARNIPNAMRARVLAVMGMVGGGFLSFILFTSNPFARLSPAPLEGRDLNPLLQDIGLAVHPPMLYMGYVGFSVAFAFAIAALLDARMDAAWARWARPWTNIAWGFLTLGIALGSWWAYYELGWGGWWFWDPVENASFMPWLIGAALMHSLAVADSRGAFKVWTLLLAVLAFSLSLLGTFLVRSGVLTSVHAFANDPARGLFILIFLSLTVGASLALFAWRAPALVEPAKFAPVSREMSLLLNNIFLCVLCFCVLLGTLYPLIYDALGLGKLSVGPPYFNTMFVLLGAPLALGVGVGALLRWRRDRLARINPLLLKNALISLGLGLLAPLPMPHYSFAAALGVALGIWILLINLSAWRARGFRATPRAFYGMLLAHAGVGVFLIGVTFTTAYGIERDIPMQVGDSFDAGGYRFIFHGVRQRVGPNYLAEQGRIEVRRRQQHITTLAPEKRKYLVQQNPTTEAAIDAGLLRDLFVALGEPLGGGAWSVRIQIKPLVRWIWLGALFMAAGGVLAASDKKYRRRNARARA